jgi:hypothetical protein
MLTVRKLALVWGVAAAALAAAGCDTDRSDGATGVAVTPAPSAGRRGAAVPRHGAERAPAGASDTAAILGWDVAAGPMVYHDGSGHLYEVRWTLDASGAVVGAEHLRDGALLAQTYDAVGGENLMVFVEGELLMDQLIMAGPPSGATRDRRPVDRTRRPPAGTMRRATAIIPCADEWQGYAAASGGLFLAAWNFRQRPSARTRSALIAAGTAFVGAWIELERCMMVASGAA